MPLHMFFVFLILVGGTSYLLSVYTLTRLGLLFERVLLLLGHANIELSAHIDAYVYLLSTTLLLLYFIAGKALPLKIMRPLGWLSGLWMGYLALTLSYAGPLHLIEWLLSLGLWTFDERVGQIIAVISILSVHLGLIWGVYNASRLPKLNQVSIKHPKISSELNGFKILQLSDIHIGPTIGGRFVERLRPLIERAKPDLIVMTGDLVDGEVSQLGAEVESFLNLSELAPRGMLLITGNHEYISGASSWVEFMKSKGADVLENENRVIEHSGAHLAVIGVEDWDAERFDSNRHSSLPQALKSVPQDAFKLLLAHQPKAAPEASRLGIDLQLSGHTHAGQIFPFNFLIYLDQPYNVGSYKLDNMILYVNPGTAYWGPPLRIGTRAEITLLTLER